MPHEHSQLWIVRDQGPNHQCCNVYEVMFHDLSDFAVACVACTFF